MPALTKERGFGCNIMIVGLGIVVAACDPATAGSQTSPGSTGEGPGSTGGPSVGDDGDAPGGTTSGADHGHDSGDGGEPTGGVDPGTGSGGPRPGTDSGDAGEDTGPLPCVPDDDATLCAAADAACGAIEVDDGCGNMITVDCGGCGAPDSCGGGGVANQCGCTGESDEDLCAAANGCEVGDLVDSCGITREVDCGACDFLVSPVCENGTCECTQPPEITNLQCQSFPFGFELDFTFDGEVELYTYVNALSQPELPANCAGPGAVALFGNVGYNDHDILSAPWPGDPCWWYRVCAHHDACMDTASDGVDIMVCAMPDGTFACM